MASGYQACWDYEDYLSKEEEQPMVEVMDIGCGPDSGIMGMEGENKGEEEDENDEHEINNNSLIIN